MAKRVKPPPTSGFKLKHEKDGTWRCGHARTGNKAWGMGSTADEAIEACKKGIVAFEIMRMIPVEFWPDKC